MNPPLFAATFIIDIIEAFGVPAVMVALLGTGGLGALVPALVAWKKAPVERKDADLAAADAAQGMSLKLAQELRTEIDRLRTEMGELRTELRGETQQRRALGEEVQAYKGTIYRLRVALSRAQDYFDHMNHNWGALRENETPPSFPILKVDD